MRLVGDVGDGTPRAAVDMLSLWDREASGPWPLRDLLHVETAGRKYFGGHREKVLARDGYRCAVPRAQRSSVGKRSLAVHHREPETTIRSE